MKIRIKGDSIRLRLTKSDIKNMGALGVIEEQTHFANTVFTYRLQRTSESTLSAIFENQIMTIFIPENHVEEWIKTDRISFETFQKIDDTHQLFILVEKDFQCLDHSREDQSDMYINPNKTC